MGEVLRMTRTELLDHFAVNAMKAQIEKMGITNPFSTAQTAYRMATEMLEHRDRILREWQKEQEMQHKQQNSDIKDLDLPIRYQRCLVSEQILMKQDLCNWTERELRRIPNLGVKGLQFVKEAMALHGLKFRGQE
jgi:DNA-directed RNA polymerase alpha subunit